MPITLAQGFGVLIAGVVLFTAMLRYLNRPLEKRSHRRSYVQATVWAEPPGAEKLELREPPPVPREDPDLQLLDEVMAAPPSDPDFHAIDEALAELEKMDAGLTVH